MIVSQRFKYILEAIIKSWLIKIIVKYLRMAKSPSIHLKIQEKGSRKINQMFKSWINQYHYNNNIEKQAKPMQNIPYILLQNSSPYYAFVCMASPSPLSPASTSQQKWDFQGSYYITQNTDNFLWVNDTVQCHPQSSTSLMENISTLDNQLHYGDQNMIAQTRHLANTTPIMQSFNGEPNYNLEKKAEIDQNPQYGNKNQKISVNSKKIKGPKIDEDKEYSPQSDKKRKPAMKYRQNQNRNIVPNEINQIFSFIQKRNKSGHIVSNLFSKFPHPEQFSPKRFYLYQSLLKNKLGHYTNQKSLKLVTEIYEPKCESWSEQEQRYYNKICRVLIRHFIYQDSIFIILTSKRMKSDKKRDHLRARRQVSESVLRIIQGY